MEMLKFYFLNIVVGCLMAVTLGHYGIHLVGRRKTLETLMIGQTMQLGIILGAFLTSLFFHNTGVIHEEHIGLIVSLLLSGFIYFCHGQCSKKWYYLKTELSLLVIILSIALSHVLTAVNPLIESHLVRSFVGDIVTASKMENYFILLITFLCGIYFFLNKKRILDESIDYGLYGHILNKKAVLFEFVIFVIMCLCIHVFGLLFTLGMLLIPIIAFNMIGNFKYSKMLFVIALINILSVCLGFLLNIQFEKLPTSPVIVILLTGLYGILILKKSLLKL
jgi:ABC-type Mn2+/Zn2+ transport system permease subunit